ncbi:MAG: MBL fold metallo-hydrolase [Sedimentisphaerales bacterium]|nr:MBL fold metallo-hydrolase [Sedimentisphaerales bacterium]
MIRTCALQSGSNGNSIYVETSDARLLFDAGISGKRAEERLAENGRAIRDVDALIISHSHSDHVSGAGVFHRKFSLPVYICGEAWQEVGPRMGKVREQELCFFDRGDTLRFGETIVETVPTAHDGMGGVAFVISHGNGKRLGIFTDLGHRFAGIEDWLRELDAVYIESNYDPEMLNNGPYPYWLKQRIKGDGGHLSNREAVELVRDCGGRLKLVVLSHLSEHNNCPNLVRTTAVEVLGQTESLAIKVASRVAVSEMFEF